jgi:hypothetical protein
VRHGSVPAGTGPDELEAFLAFHLDQGGVDRSWEARVVQLDGEVVAIRVLGGLLPGRAQLHSAGEDAEVWTLLGGLSTRASLALTLRVRVRIEPEKPLPLEVKVPMVAIVVSFQFFGPRLSRPRWLATDRGRSTRTPRGRHAVEGSQGATFLSIARNDGKAGRGRKSRPAVAGIRARRSASDDGLRSDTPNRGRHGRVSKTDRVTRRRSRCPDIRQRISPIATTSKRSGPVSRPPG